MIEPKHVFTITVLSGKDKSLRIREWGYYFKQADATEVIETNATDISELDYYHYAILAKKGEGPLAIPETIQWYKFLWKTRNFVKAVKISQPKQYRHLFFQ